MKTDQYGNQIHYKWTLNSDTGGSANRTIYDVILTVQRPRLPANDVHLRNKPIW